MIHSRVVWMLRPVERSITVSAPQRIDHTILSISSSTEEVTAELPILALILVRKLRPIAIGSSSAWFMFGGEMGGPPATPLRPTARHLVAHEFRRHEQRHRGAEAFAVVMRGLRTFQHLLAAEILALGHVDHFL